MAVVGYCVKCKAKKEMVNPQEGVTKNNRIITKGTCPDCGTKMSLIGGLKKQRERISISSLKAASVAFFVVGFLLGMALQQKAARLQGTRRAEQGEVLHF